MKRINKCEPKADGSARTENTIYNKTFRLNHSQFEEYVYKNFVILYFRIWDSFRRISVSRGTITYFALQFLLNKTFIHRASFIKNDIKNDIKKL